MNEHNCNKCNNTQWVCEWHPDKEAHQCCCGGAGMPCSCNPDFKKGRKMNAEIWTVCTACNKRVTGDSIHTCSPQEKQEAIKNMYDTVIANAILYGQGFLRFTSDGKCEVVDPKQYGELGAALTWAAENQAIIKEIT